MPDQKQGYDYPVLFSQRGRCDVVAGLAPRGRSVQIGEHDYLFQQLTNAIR